MSKEPTPPPPSPDEMARILRAQDWATLRARLFHVARKRTKSRDLATELADAVIADCCDPEASPWNPNAEPDLTRHAFWVLRNKMSAERKKLNVRENPVNVTTVEIMVPRPADPAHSLQRAQEQASAARIVAAARARLHDPLDLQVLELWLDDIDKPADQAAQLAKPIEEIRRSRERLKYALQVAKDQEEATSWKPGKSLPKKF
ncbi:MAG TPA: hypothetical protein VGY54_04840 [Polyangiaceae bacterium]|jgi:hypothetical protein|nr:hypothetical protein [Polyangiaceae bacterium]